MPDFNVMQQNCVIFFPSSREFITKVIYEISLDYPFSGMCPVSLLHEFLCLVIIFFKSVVCSEDKFLGLNEIQRKEFIKMPSVL